MYVKMRVNHDSPWKLTGDENRLLLSNQQRGIQYEVSAVERPAFYGNIPNTDLNYEQFAQRLGPDLIGVMLSHYCIYPNMPLGKEFSRLGDRPDSQVCGFCELAPTFETSGIFHTKTKPLELIVKSVKHAVEMEPGLKYMIVNAGSWLGNLKDGPDYDGIVRKYIEFVKMLREEGVDLHLYCLTMPPTDFELIKELNEVGGGTGKITMMFNLEVYEDKFAEVMVPGKYKHYGRERHYQAFQFCQDNGIRAITDVLYGILSWNPFDKTQHFDGEREADALAEATIGLTKKGIMPLVSFYHHSPRSIIGHIPFTPDEVWKAYTNYADAVLGSDLYKRDYADATFGSRNSLPNTMEQDFILGRKYNLI
jgi:hypothetical protein